MDAGGAVGDVAQPAACGGRVAVTPIDARTILTPSSGFISLYKFTLNPYSGCAFGCSYCYARYFVSDRGRRETWGSWVSAKQDAGTLVARACNAGTLQSGDKVYTSSVTDPYQPAERRLAITRGVLETLLEHGVQPRLTIQTRSPLATRDIDLFQRFDRIRINFTIATDSDDVRRRYEPRCPPIDQRFGAAADVAAAGVPIGISISPMLPIGDAEAFARRLRALRAAEYVTQYFKPPGRRFAASTAAVAIDQAREDGWGHREYEQARETIAGVLGERFALLEGGAGYAPAW
jgi:DNA repair photolyase